MKGKAGGDYYLHGRNDFDTATLSKVITQSRPFFYDDQAGDQLMEEVDALEEEDLERILQQCLDFDDRMIWQEFSFSSTTNKKLPLRPK